MTRGPSLITRIGPHSRTRYSCSDLHPWFLESRSSLTHPKRNWFMWRKPLGFNPDGSPIPPNNWRAAFGGSVWEWDEGTGEYYLHLFAKGQPDFNWEDEEVRKALYEEAVTFWLERGVDGFRCVDGLPRPVQRI